MKRILLIISIVLILLLALSLAACGGDGEQPEEQLSAQEEDVSDDVVLDYDQVEEPEDIDFGSAPVYAGSDVINTILSGSTARNYSHQAVEEELIQAILESGNQATSAQNKQPWRFTVARGGDLVSQMIRDIPDGPVAIIISASTEEIPGVNATFDSALATQNMYIAAQSLGLGAHIYAAPVDQINSNLREALSIPAGYNAVAVLLVGYEEINLDAVSSASQRNELSTVVNYAD